MTVAKEPINSRPHSQHRHTSSMAGSLPKSRPHSHSLSVGSINPAHRVTRRKSMSSTAASNVVAMAAAAKSAPRVPKPPPGYRGPSLTNYPAMASSVPSNNSAFTSGSYGTPTKSEAVTDGPSLASMPEQDKGNNKARARRASEGARLSKGDGKRAQGGELRCEHCNKQYKHSSCLTKHLWEHTPEWQYTSKLLISKHQQVQLLEAASVLVKLNQNQDGDLAPDSDHSSVSPPASGSSDMRELSSSSTENTPPPQLDEQALGSFPRYAQRSPKRYSTNSSSAYSQSYQSAVFSDNGYGHYRQWSNVSDRPTTSGTSVAGSYQDENDQADLAAAVGLLSCSYGTPKTGPVALPPDVPPVPPLPSKYLGFGNPGSISGSTAITAQQSSIRGSGLGHRQYESKDVDMDDESFADEDEYRHANSHSRGRADDEDDGIFGRMEE